MSPTTYRVLIAGPGAVSTMAAPRGDLVADVAQLRAEGVDLVVSALSVPEIAALGLGGESAAVTGAGMGFVHIPIADRSTPALRLIEPQVRELAEDYRQGRHLVLHCRYGIGRSSLLAAAVLVLAGNDPDEVWDAISQARGVRVPDTQAQRRWTDQLLRPPDAMPPW